MLCYAMLCYAMLCGSVHTPRHPRSFRNITQHNFAQRWERDPASVWVRWTWRTVFWFWYGFGGELVSSAGAHVCVYVLFVCVSELRVAETPSHVRRHAVRPEGEACVRQRGRAPSVYSYVCAGLFHRIVGECSECRTGRPETCRTCSWGTIAPLLLVAFIAFVTWTATLYHLESHVYVLETGHTLSLSP